MPSTPPPTPATSGHDTKSPHVHDFTPAEFEVISAIWHHGTHYRDMTQRERDVWNHYRRNITAAHNEPDEAVVEQAIAGYRPSMNKAERRLAIEALLDKGLSFTRIAEVLDISRTTVARRAQLRSKDA